MIPLILYFNTSYVVIKRSQSLAVTTTMGISIHLMLLLNEMLLIKVSLYGNFNTSYVVIKLLVFFNFINTPTNFNTSYVVIKL